MKSSYLTSKKLSIFLVGCLTFLVFTLRSISYNQCEIIDIIDHIKYDKNIPVENLLHCTNSISRTKIHQRGEYRVLYNFVRASRNFNCDESITLAAPGDFRFLDNIAPLAKIWRGPISIALYAPGHDLNTTLRYIAYIRHCTNDYVKELVTFHVFFENAHIEKMNTPIINLYNDYYDCTSHPLQNFNESLMYKNQNNLLFPINVARNIARETANTHFILSLDIELFPTPNFIKSFMDLVKRRPKLFSVKKRNVFVLPIFEVLSNAQIPQKKTELQKMYLNKTAFWFHEKLCKKCHYVIKWKEWMAQAETKNLDVFASGKRIDYHKGWEPFFISTHREPIFDERLTWEGQGNKMSQAYALCLMDYKFNVLNNAFLVHKPGLKKKKKQLLEYQSLVNRTETLLNSIIKYEHIKLYGNNSRCVVKVT